jgi:hypothetical protein
MKRKKKMEDDLINNIKKNGRRPQKKMGKNEDDIKKKLFSIPLKFRANLSWDWLSSLRFLYVKSIPFFSFSVSTSLSFANLAQGGRGLRICLCERRHQVDAV